MTVSSMPVSSRTTRTKSPPFSASRTARGGDGDDGVDAGALGLPAKAADAVGGAGERVGRDHALERRVAEPHHLLGAIERLDLAVGRDAGDEQVDAVGPDVEGGDLHGQSL